MSNRNRTRPLAVRNRTEPTKPENAASSDYSFVKTRIAKTP